MTTIPVDQTERAVKIRRTRNDWLTLIKEWEGSGQTQQAFCRSRSLCYRRFNQWKNRTTKEKDYDESSLDAEPIFVPVQLNTVSETARDTPIVITLPNRIQVSLSNQGELSPVLALIQQLLILSC